MKLNITSGVIEKGLDLAKDFLGKLITPAIEETGLLIKEQVTYLKFKNQVRILNKAREYCTKHNISPKTISLKILVPLLDNGALEEEDFLQDKWAVLLSNMVDSSQNIQNHVFPFLLSQISTNEFQVVEKIYRFLDRRKQKLILELDAYNRETAIQEKTIMNQIKLFGDPGEDDTLAMQQMDLENALSEIEKGKEKIVNAIKEPEYLTGEHLFEFELQNLIRLGIVKVIPLNYGYANSIGVRYEPDADYLYADDVEIHVNPDGEKYILSELGILFLKACSEKK